MHCAIWYHLYNLKNVKNTHGGVLILIKLQAKPEPVKSPTSRAYLKKSRMISGVMF